MKKLKKKIKRTEFNKSLSTLAIITYGLFILLVVAILMILGLRDEVGYYNSIIGYVVLENDNLRAQYGLCNDKLNVCAAQITDWREHQLCFNTPPTIIGVDSVVIR